MKTSYKNKISQSLISVFLCGCVLGALIFFIIYGTSIVNPQNDKWLLRQNSDMTQHYLGWVFFRRSEWKFPLGLMDGLSYNHLVSCMFTDSIPLLAIFFKILSPVLPHTFQYTGMWCLFCHMAQGGISASILHKFSKNPLFCLIGSMFFIVSPPELHRMFMHESLGGHWIILFALCIWIYNDHKWKCKATPIILWTLCGILAVSVHAYFVPMVYMILIGYVIIDIAKNHKIIRPILSLVSTTIFTLITMYIIGAFYGNGDMDANGLGKFSANLNTFFNGMNVSKILKPLHTSYEQYEGFGYLGFGMLIAGVLSLVMLSEKVESASSTFIGGAKKIICSYKWEIISVMSVMCLCLFFAASPVCTFNGHILYKIEYSHSIAKKLSIFRASGRFIWVADYILYTFILAAISKLGKFKTSIIALTFCAAMQIYDLKDFVILRHRSFSHQAEYTSPLKNEKWNKISENSDMVVFMSMPNDVVGIMKMYFVFAEYADENNLNLSSFHIARKSNKEYADYVENQYKLLENGKADKENIYLFADGKPFPHNKNLNVYKIDGYIAVKMK